MSFVWKRPEGRLKSPEQCAREVLDVAMARQLDEFAAVLAVMCIAQESDFWCPWNRADDSSQRYAFDSESNDGRSVGYLQQQNGRAGEELPVGDRDNWWGPMSSRMDLKRSVNEFLRRLEANYHDAITDPALASNHFISNVQRPRPDLRGAYAKHWDRAWQLVKAAQSNNPQPGVQPMPDAPLFKELDFMTGGGRSNRSRPPSNWLIHTEEGNSSAENLARYCNGSHDVSYHYTLRDGILCDVVDTDYASWSVLDANANTINLCFAGSRAAMTRDEWLARDADLRIAAFIAVADCRKYKIPLDIIAPPYGNPRPGISDHKYVTQALHIGTHTDVGDNFPWDVFGRYVSESAGTAPSPVSPPPFVPDVLDRAGGTIDDQLLYRWNCLGGQTHIEALAEIRDKVCGTNDRGKTGVKTL